MEKSDMHAQFHESTNVNALRNVKVLHGKLYARKRTGKDIFVTVLHVVSAIGWTTLSMALIFLARACPSRYFDRTLDTVADKVWNPHTLQLSFTMFITTLIISMVGLIINAIGHHDHKRLFFRFNLVVLAFISLFGIFFYLFR